jgi:hypothetical protein
MTQRGGPELRIIVAHHAEEIAQLMLDHPDDLRLQEQCMTLLGHAFSASIRAGDRKSKDSEKLNTAKTLSAVIALVKKPGRSQQEIIQSIDLIADMARGCYEVSSKVTEYHM